MAKTKISEFDIDPANNTDINSINIAEGCAPSGINNAIRQLMSDLKEFQTGAGGDSITATGVYSDTIGEKTSAAGVTVDGVLLKDNAVTASGGFSGALNGAVGGTTPAAGAFTTLSASGAFSANGGATLGDASGDALTINSSAVSIPNGLNFDSNTLVIDATNNRVGVGTASPSATLSVTTSTMTNQIFVDSMSDSTTYGLVSLNASRTSTSYLGIAGGGGTDKTLFYNVPSTGKHSFRNNFSEQMVLDSSGNLGLGVTPSAWSVYKAFDIGRGALVNASTETDLVHNAYWNGTNWIYKATDYATHLLQINGQYRFYTAPSGTAGNAITFTQAMTLDASGRLGIGTSSPSRRLDVITATSIPLRIGTGDSNMAMEFVSSLGTRYNWLIGGQYNVSQGFEITPSTAAGGTTYSTPAFVVLAGGNVGIGTSSPGGKLDLSGTSRQIFYVSDAYTEYRSVNSAGSAFAKQAYNALSYDWGLSNVFGKMVLDSSGNLGLGVTPSAWGTLKALQVGTSALANTGGNTYLYANSYYNGSAWIYSQSTTSGGYNINGNVHSWFTAPSGTAGNAITFTQAMTLDASGRLFLGATSGIGQERMLIATDSSGTYSQALNIKDTYASANANNFIVFRKSDDTYLGHIKRSTTSDALYIGGNSFLALGSGDTERMRIDSSGNVGVGTSSPSTYNGKLVVKTSDQAVIGYFGGTTYATRLGANASFATVEGVDAATGVSSYQPLQIGGSLLKFDTGGSERMRIDSSGNLLTGGLTSTPGQADSNSTSGQVLALNTKRELRWYGTNASIYGGSGGADDNLYYYSGNAHIWRTNGAERARIDISGNLLVGTTSVVSSSVTGIQAYRAGQACMALQRGTDYGAVQAFHNYSGALVGYVQVNASTTTYATSSDYRLKENIAPMTGALEKVAQLKPVTYTWKSTGEASQGFIAHELQAVVPDCVTGEKDAVDAEGNPVYQGIDTSFLVATLTAAIQEQQAIITDLKARIETLESK